jgi:hypothetical protein
LFSAGSRFPLSAPAEQTWAADAGGKQGRDGKSMSEVDMPMRRAFLCTGPSLNLR